MLPKYIPSVPLEIPSETALLLWEAQLAWQEKVGWVVPMDQLIFNTTPTPLPENQDDSSE